MGGRFRSCARGCAPDRPPTLTDAVPHRIPNSGGGVPWGDSRVQSRCLVLAGLDAHLAATLDGPGHPRLADPVAGDCSAMSSQVCNPLFSPEPWVLGGRRFAPTWIGEGIAVGVVEGCEKIRPRIAGFPAILHDFATGHTRCGHFKVQPSGKVVQKLRFLRVYSQIFEDYAVYRRAGLRRQFRGLCRLSRIMPFIVELA